VGDVGSPRLYAVYLGGDPAPGRLTEDHEVVLVVASDVSGARTAARAKWGAPTRPHVDGVMEIEVVDGFRVQLEPTSSPDAVPVDLTYEPAEE
jgi:hypothetical protein